MSYKTKDITTKNPTEFKPNYNIQTLRLGIKSHYRVIISTGVFGSFSSARLQKASKFCAFGTRNMLVYYTFALGESVAKKHVFLTVCDVFTILPLRSLKNDK